MTSVYRVRAVWQGFQGSPGYSNFSFSGLGTDTSNNAAGAAVRAFFDGLKGLLLSAWTVQVQAEILELDMATGHLLGAQNMTTVPSIVTGTSGATSFAGGSGFAITWGTGLIFNGRRVKGRTFIVPAAGVYEADGTLSSAIITIAKSAGDGLIAATGAEFCVWAKQWNTSTHPPTQIGGALPPVQTCTIKDMASQLRSRRL